MHYTDYRCSNLLKSKNRNKNQTTDVKDILWLIWPTLELWCFLGIRITINLGYWRNKNSVSQFHLLRTVTHYKTTPPTGMLNLKDTQMKVALQWLSHQIKIQKTALAERYTYRRFHLIYRRLHCYYRELWAGNAYHTMTDLRVIV